MTETLSVPDDVRAEAEVVLWHVRAAWNDPPKWLDQHEEENATDDN